MVAPFPEHIREQVQTVVFENDLESWGWAWLVAGVDWARARAGA